MKNKENQLLEKIKKAHVTIPQSIIPKINDNPRQVVYSYLKIHELIKVASLSIREREIVINSKILKQNRKKSGFICNLATSQQNKYSTDVAVKGLLIAIQLSSKFALNLDKSNSDAENCFKQVFHAMIAAVVIAGTKLDVFDEQGDESLNGIAADEIEKAGAILDHLCIKKSVILGRMMTIAEQVSLFLLSFAYYPEIVKVIETNTELPHLKVLNCRLGEIAVPILARSQLEEFQVDSIMNEPALLLLLATQTQLKKVSVGSISNVGAFIDSLPKSVQYFSIGSVSGDKDKEQYLVLLLNCTVKYVEMKPSKAIPLEEMLDKYLDTNQQSDGNRRRCFYGWNFRVNANNRIFNLQRPNL